MRRIQCGTDLTPVSCLCRFRRFKFSFPPPPSSVASIHFASGNKLNVVLRKLCVVSLCTEFGRIVFTRSIRCEILSSSRCFVGLLRFGCMQTYSWVNFSLRLQPRPCSRVGAIAPPLAAGEASLGDSTAFRTVHMGVQLHKPWSPLDCLSPVVPQGFALRPDC